MPSLFIPEAIEADLDSKQSATINKFVKLDPEESRAIAFHKVGTGKTRLAYGWFLHLRSLGRAKRCLCILRPKAIYDWRTEADLIGYDRESINYVSFADLKSVKLTIPYDTIIIDELFLFANPKTYRSRRLGYLCGKATNVLGLSGTILPKEDNTAIWGYSVVIGISHHIATSLTSFRSLYQTSFKARFNEQVRLFRPVQGWEQKIYSRLGSRVSIYFPKDYARTIDRTVAVPYTKNQSRLINKLVKYYVLDTPDGEIFFTRATEVYHFVRQITNGWLSTSSGELRFLASEKRDACLTKMDELHDSGERCIVWCAYRNDVKMLQALFPHKSLALVGGSTFDHVAWSRGDVKTVIATMGSGQSINYLNQSKFALFFSLSTKRLDWQQSRGRMGRRGVDGSSASTYIRYLVSGSVDGKIYNRIQKTEDCEASLIQQFIKDYNIKLPV